MRLHLFIDECRIGPFRRLGRTQRKVRAAIRQHILPGIVSPMSGDYLSEHYPWCFVISGGMFSRKYFCVGAFVVLQREPGEKSLAVIYSKVRYSWLEKNMRTEFPLTFWAARILNGVQQSDIAEKNWQPLWQWVKALKWSYSPLFQKILTPAMHFRNHSQVLLREGSQEDYRIRSSDGVEIMPWKNWPDCIQQEAGIWIWRQSRHRKILDSQRIPLGRAGA